MHAYGIGQYTYSQCHNEHRMSTHPQGIPLVVHHKGTPLLGHITSTWHTAPPLLLAPLASLPAKTKISTRKNTLCIWNGKRSWASCFFLSLRATSAISAARASSFFLSWPRNRQLPWSPCIRRRFAASALCTVSALISPTALAVQGVLVSCAITLMAAWYLCSKYP